MKTTTLMNNEITLHLFDAIPSIKLYRCDVIFSQLGSFNNEIKLFECPIALQQDLKFTILVSDRIGNKDIYHRIVRAVSFMLYSISAFFFRLSDLPLFHAGFSRHQP